VVVSCQLCLWLRTMLFFPLPIKTTPPFPFKPLPKQPPTFLLGCLDASAGVVPSPFLFPSPYYGRSGSFFGRWRSLPPPHPLFSFCFWAWLIGPVTLILVFCLLSCPARVRVRFPRTHPSPCVPDVANFDLYSRPTLLLVWRA